MIFRMLGPFPFHQKFQDSRSETEWNNENFVLKKFSKIECTLFDGISGIIENFVFHSQEKSAIVRYCSLFATLLWNSSICCSGKLVGHADELPVRIRPVCTIACANS